MNNASYPVLYSFRRCPYAMRARLALAKACIAVELREVSLKNKPPEMLRESPKGTVPVLKLTSGKVIDESLDIAAWACDEINDPAWSSEWFSHDWLRVLDKEFKRSLDAYKYADIRVQGAEEAARQACLGFLFMLDDQLRNGRYLSGEGLGVLDAMIFPFVRQFAGVDAQWFEGQSWLSLIDWVNKVKCSELFTSVMKKYPVWQTPEDSVFIDWL